MHAVALLLFLTGCDALFRLSEVAPPSDVDARVNDAPADSNEPVCPLVETFSTTTADLIPNWMRMQATGCALAVDDGVLVADVVPEVECYGELTSRNRFSFEKGGSVSTEIRVSNLSGPAEAFLNLQLDDDDFYYMNVTGGSLGILTRTNGADNDAMSIQYDAIEHAYVRIELRPGATEAMEVVYQTSFDGQSWVERAVSPARVPFTSLSAQIGIGTYDPGAPAQRVRFDNVTVCAQ